MARIRTIKPDFFLDPHMDAVDERHQKLYQGLWMLADKEGRLYDEPQRIKAQVFPYRDYDVNEMLQGLADAGFIVRYEVQDGAYIAIPKFPEHQRPHPKELALGIPHPPKELLDSCREKKRQAVKRNGNGPSREISRPAVKSPVETRVVSPQEGKGRSLGEWTMENGEPKPPPLPEKPDDPFADGQSFFAQLQLDRHAAGYVTERPPNVAALGAFFSEFMGELNGDKKRAAATCHAFFKSPYWRDRNCPFGAFMKNWREFVPRRAVA